ncbi:hypothetical protein GGI17_002004 [Coemansia sp. S146]|nr:hypothetical protein GGI17_002004 [Coemansia sp. S146]
MNAVRNHNFVIARLAQIIAVRAVASTANDHAAAPVADCATAPAVNPVETLALQHHLPAVSPLVGGPVADTTTGPSAAYVPPPCLPTATPSAARSTATLKRKVWDLYGEDSDEPGASMVVSSSKRGVLLNVSSPSRLGARPSIRGHNNNSGHSYVKQGGPSHTIYDCSDDKVTIECLLAVIKPSIFFDLDFASKIYRQTYGCFLMACGIKPNHFVNKLAKVGGFEHWLPRLETTDSAGLARMNILRRCDPSLKEICLDVLQQVGLAENPDAVVLGPRLCHALVTMCGMRVGLMTGPVIDSMFWPITGRYLQTLYIATQQGIQHMTANSICQMVKHWVERLCQFIATNNGMKRSLVAARECNDYYKEQCGGDSHGDPGGLLAKEILKSNILLSLLLLGIDMADLETFYKRLVHVASKHTNTHTKECLEQLSKQLSNWPNTL